MSAPESFQSIASDPDKFRTFSACIGDANAPSRVLAARRAVAHRAVLDLGCGPAVWWATLWRVAASFGPDTSAPIYTGADASSAMLDHARRLFPELDREERLVHVPEVRLPWGASHFPFVHVRHVLEHLENPLDLLREALRVADRELFLAFSQYTHSIRRRGSILTDEHLGAKRWAHSTSVIEAVIVEAGFHVTQRNLSPTIREETWICCRLGQ